MVLPEPVGPVTKIIPLGALVHVFHVSDCVVVNPRAKKSWADTSGAKIRMTIFSPNAVGMVDRRNSIS